MTRSRDVTSPQDHPSMGCCFSASIKAEGTFSWGAGVAFPPDLLFLDMSQFKSPRVPVSPPP